MLLYSLIFTPLFGIFIICNVVYGYNNINIYLMNKIYKQIALIISVVNFIISIVVYFNYNNGINQFQFIDYSNDIQTYNIYLGLDGISIYFVLLTTIIIPISLISNWNSIDNNVKSFLIIILLLESLLLAVFLSLDILLFYIFFESILPPLFLLIGIFGSYNKVKASYYLFLYTLGGSLFLLLSILTIYSTLGITDYDSLFKCYIDYKFQIFIYIGIIIAFSVKTPVIFLNNWLLKAHVESPLGGSIILAGIVLKLSLYGIFRLILPILPKVSLNFTYILYVIGIITILYASFSTLKTLDIKELIAYSSVCHAAVYFIAGFSNIIQGLEGSIILGLAHGFVSSGLFICVGGILYDRSGTRIINHYRGIAQIMPVFSILFFILCLGNCGAPLTLNFLGEFLSLYGIFERLPIAGIFACSSIILSAAYTIYMYNRTSFGGVFGVHKSLDYNIIDVNLREFVLLFTLVCFTLVLGVYPDSLLTVLHYCEVKLVFIQDHHFNF